MSKFLEDLKNAADNGEFNSEAAKKINDITKLTETKLTASDRVEELEKIKESLENRIEDSEKKNIVVTKEEALEFNTEYERKMEQFKKQDMVNAQLATLIEIEDMVKASVIDMFSFVEELESRFEKEFETEDTMFGNLYQKIEELKSKYKNNN